MTFAPARSLLYGAALLLTFVAAPTAQASTVSFTTDLVGLNILTSPATSFGQNIAASFAAFDGSLGTLTGVSFAYDYEYAFTYSSTGQGGGGGGLNNGLGVNGTPGTLSNQPAFVTLNAASQDYSVTGTTAASAADLSLFASAYKFNDYAFGGFSAGGNPNNFSYNASLDLLASSVTVTYTFTPALATVPEPSTVALVGISALGLALARRRKGGRSRPSTGGHAD